MPWKEGAHMGWDQDLSIAVGVVVVVALIPYLNSSCTFASSRCASFNSTGQKHIIETRRRTSYHYYYYYYYYYYY